jgi:uncharacterized protein (DUF1499 family)
LRVCQYSILILQFRICNIPVKWKLFFLIAGSLVLLPIVGLALLSAFSRRPSNLGVVDGHLGACPDSPNCISTEANDREHRMEPLSFRGSAREAVEKIKAVIASLPRTRIVDESENYLHVEFTSALFRFVDDVEFLINEPAATIHFRSASRVGHGDLGANRRRMEQIAAAFH